MTNEIKLRGSMTHEIETGTLAERLARLSPERLAQLVQGLQDRIDGLRAKGEGPIAVIGLALRLPGAKDPESFWDLIREGGVAFSEVPANRWEASALAWERIPCWGGFLGEIDRFDAEFFHISPHEAAAMDPQQRLAAEVAWEALERAGYSLAERRPPATGIFLGVSTNDYRSRFLSRGPARIDPRMATGTANSLIAGRLSYFLDLTGPSLVVDTACSSSLVATHLACRSLRTGECDMALAGGVGLLIEPEMTIALSKLGMLSRRGACNPFTAEADGYVRGEGAAILVLKRLGDAKRDNDPILAVIRGSSVNQDGRSNGLTAPNGSAQRAVITAALADANLSASEVDAIECHGTATPLGDPIEIEALASIYGIGRDSQHALALGSVKANIGHLEAAAGAAGLAKTILCLMHKTWPRQPAMGPLNPRVDWDKLPLRVAQSDIQLGEGAERLARVGVSGFGFSGTNAHMILEEAPPRPAPSGEGSVGPYLIALSARGSEDLVAFADCVADNLSKPQASDPAIQNLARNLVVDRNQYGWRCAGIDIDPHRLIDEIRTAAQSAREPKPKHPRIAFLFTGQGSQWAGMGEALAKAEPIFRDALDECAGILRRLIDADLLELLWAKDCPDAARLDQTRYTQPAIFALEYALAKLWRHWGVEPEIMAGHSIGEYTAACLAGVIDLQDALELVSLRGQLTQELPDGGGMLAIEASEKEALHWLELFPQLDLAAVNATNSIVMAAPSNTLADLAKTLPPGSFRHLRVSHAFHSRAVNPILPQFREKAAQVQLRSTKQPILSSLTGRLVTHEMANPEYWVRHLREPVLFASAMSQLFSKKIDVVIEIGPRPILRSYAVELGVEALASMNENELDNTTILKSLASVFTAGVNVDWRAFHSSRGGKPCPAPNVPFHRQHYWIDRPAPLENENKEQQASKGFDAPQPMPFPDKIGLSVESEIREIVAQSMQLPSAALRPETPFVEQGADSLILTRVAARIEQRCGVKVLRRDLFGPFNTLSTLQAHVAKNLPLSKQHTSPLVAKAQEAPSEASAQPSDPALQTAVSTHIDQLSRRLAVKLCGSRTNRNESTGMLADSRGSAGYRPALRPLLYPLAGDRAEGARIWDVDGNEYLDISMGFGVQLFGHAAPFVTEALQVELGRGLHLGPQARRAGEAARRICRLTGVERVAFCNTGTEAVMTALRLARLTTGRKRVAIFEGSYHGHFDGVLGNPGASPERAQPLSAGTPGGFVQDLLVLDYADESASFALLEQYQDDLAAVLVEPVQSRRPSLQPRAFLNALRAFTEQAGIALIFDEVLLGFRIALGGAQAWAGVEADLVTYGKIIGGGLPIGVVGGKRNYMDKIDGGAWALGNSGPAEPSIFFAGTFNKNPLTMAASIAVLEHLESEGTSLQERLNQRTSQLALRLNVALAERTAAMRVDSASSLFRFIGAPDLFYYHCLERGLYVWEGRTCFLSTRHTNADLNFIFETVLASVDALIADGILAGVDTNRDTKAEAPPRAVEMAPKSTPLTEGQKGLWLTCQMSENVSAAYNQSLRISFGEPPNRNALRTALVKVIGRHPNMRARFQPDGRSVIFAPNANIELIDLGEDAEKAERFFCWRPFDLEYEAPCRAALSWFKGVWRLTLVLPHIVTDGWSLAVMVEELAAFYTAALTGIEARLPEPDSPILYCDAVNRAGAKNTVVKSFVERFTPPPQPLVLPLARPRLAVQTYEGGRITRKLDAEQVRRLKTLCGRLGVGLFAAGLAAYARLLGRLARTNDIATGIFRRGNLCMPCPAL